MDMAVLEIETKQYGTITYHCDSLINKRKLGRFPGMSGSN